jgi:hypothetical protein
MLGSLNGAGTLAVQRAHCQQQNPIALSCGMYAQCFRKLLRIRQLEPKKSYHEIHEMSNAEIN